MKLLVAALVIALAVAHGSEAASLEKRDVQSDLDRLSRIITDMSASIGGAAQDLVEKVKALEVTNAAQTRIQPLVEKVQAEAVRLQEQVRPLTDNLNTQVKPLADMMEKFFQQVMDQTKALLPPQ